MQCVSASGDCRGFGCNNSRDNSEVSDCEEETGQLVNEDNDVENIFDI